MTPEVVNCDLWLFIVEGYPWRMTTAGLLSSVSISISNSNSILTYTILTYGYSLDTVWIQIGYRFNIRYAAGN